MTLALRTATGALLLAGMLAGGTAWGQGAPAPASEASRREARLLGVKLGWEPQVRGIINTVRTQIIVSLAQVNGKTPQEMIGAVDDLLMPVFMADASGLAATIVEAWAETFTPDELRNLRSFYGTPLGEKLLRSIPLLNTRIEQTGQNWAQRIYQQAQQKHADEFTKRGLKFAP